MSSSPSPEETVAAAQALLAEVTRHLADTDEAMRTQLQALQELTTRYSQERGESLRGHLATQLRRARLEPGLPAQEIAVDDITHFHRQVWRRRNAV